MTEKKPLSEKPRKKKVIKKKRNKVQRFFREKRKTQEQKKLEREGKVLSLDNEDEKTVKKWKVIIPIILLAVIVASGAITFAILKYQEGVRRQEAMKLMQEARESRKQKEKTQRKDI